MPVARSQPIKRIAQRACLLLVTRIGGKIDVEPGHLVETDHAIGRATVQIARHPGGEFRVAPRVAQRLDRNDNDLEAFRNLSVPFERIDANRVPAGLAGQRDAQKIALQAAEREILVKTKSELHQHSPGGASTPRGRL